MLFAGMGRLSENSVVNTKNKSWSLEAKIVVREAGATGVIMAQGGRFGGWSVYLDDGHLCYVYNTLGIHQYETRADTRIAVGEHGSCSSSPTTVVDRQRRRRHPSVDGAPVAQGRVEITHPMIWPAEETATIGRDAGTPVGSYSISDSVCPAPTSTSWSWPSATTAPITRSTRWNDSALR